MAHARGVMLLAAQNANVEIINLPATMVKKAVVGSGHAGKLQVQKAVMTRLGIVTAKEIPADVTDALVV